MGNLNYFTIASLDGYTEDRDGNFDWAEPGAEAHAFANDLERPVGTHLYGRRMYETMAAWETDASLAAHSEVMRDFAESWQAKDKIVFSKTLREASTERTRIEREFDPEAVRQIKESAASDLTVGGPELAGQALKAGLVDECQLFIAPVVVGSGKRWLPDEIRLALELLEERRFPDGMVYLRYGVKGSPRAVVTSGGAT
jgi:dihydrofolate reductase